MDETKMGWMAGILDLKGHVVRKNNKTRARGSMQIAVNVETTDAPIVTKLSQMTGTAPTTALHNHPVPEEWKRRGCAEHCPEAHVHTVVTSMPDIGRWTIAGASAGVVLWNLRPYMVSEDEPWDWALAMTLASTRLSGQGSGAAVAAIRRLASLGWELPPLMRDVGETPVTESAG
jgi:hypothetical protein